MKKNLLSGILLATAVCFGVNAQTTLYVPSGTSGIGSSANSNVGIGTTSTPAQKLEVNGNLKLNGHVMGYQTTGTLGLFSNTQFSDGGGLILYGNQASVGPTDKRFGDIELWAGNGNDSTKIGNINFMLFNGSYGENIMHIDGAARKVGVGTLSPTAKLHVAGDAIITDKLNIGTSSFPTCTTGIALKLFVDGKIGAQEVVVSTTNWCDYVFEQGYKLKPLNEVEKYIQANKHLPEVPSEKEVLESGVAMGEMIKIHMKKIEELTLYMIELQKENELLRIQNQQIINMISK